MADNRKKAAFRMLFLIATPKLVNKATALFKEGNVPMQYVFHAQGTATSDVMDMLGLDGVDKNILMSMMPKFFADEMLKKLRKKLHLGMPNVRRQRASCAADRESGAGRGRKIFGQEGCRYDR